MQTKSGIVADLKNKTIWNCEWDVILKSINQINDFWLEMIEKCFLALSLQFSMTVLVIVVHNKNKLK